MKHSKFEKKVAKLVETGWETGTDGKDMAFALLKAGLMLVRDGEGDQVSELIVRLNDNNGVQMEWPKVGLRASIISNFPTPSTNADMFDMLVKAGNQFLFYAGQHAAKGTPESDAKAAVNRDFADQCWHVIGGRPETADPAPIERKPGLDAWKGEVEAQESAVRPDSSPVQADLPFMAPIDAHGASIALLRDIHEAPAKSLAFQGEDRFIAIMLTGLGYLKVDDVSDVVSLTTEGRMLAGYRPDGHMDLPVEVAEITGNIAEQELAARYIDSKIAGTDRHIAEAENPVYREAYEHVAIVLQAIAKEFRMGMHLPSAHFEGRVIPYSEDRSTGIMHSDGLARFFDDVYQRNVKAGWWTDISTGQPKKRSVGELFILMVTELVEAYAAYLTQEPDDKLPQFPGLGVEMGDLLIRVADFCGALAAGNIVEDTSVANPGAAAFDRVCVIAREYESIRKTPAANGMPELGNPIPAQDVAVMVDAKLAFNATRADHKIENRLKDDGKRT